MRLSPDEMIFWQHGFLKLNGTIVFTWGLMLVLAVGSKLITRKLCLIGHRAPLRSIEAVFDRGEARLRHWNRLAGLSPGRQ
jgi:hypothetical protein